LVPKHQDTPAGELDGAGPEWHGVHFLDDPPEFRRSTLDGGHVTIFRAAGSLTSPARALADLAGSPDIRSNNVPEALQHRSLDRNLFH